MIICLTSERARRRNRTVCPQDERAAYLELERRRLERIARAVRSEEDATEALEAIGQRIIDRSTP